MYRIMIVDDDTNYRYAVRQLLDWQQHGFKVVAEAVHGQHALELLAQAEVDLIISDISMPVMNGVELVRAVKEQYPAVSVIALSGYDDYEYVREVLKLGASDYLLKMDMQPGAMLQAARDAVCVQEDEQLPFSPKVRAAIRYIRRHHAEPLTVQAIADTAELSPNYLSSLFKAETGERVVEFISRIRVEKAIPLVLDGRLKAYEIAEAVGFENAAYFSTMFKKITGSTVQNYTHQNRKS